MILERFWRLDGHNPVPCTMMEWAKTMELGSRRVAETITKYARVSTVFLGLDHRFGGGGPPILFETMIFGLRSDHAYQDYQERCCTWDEAIAQHARAVEVAARPPTRKKKRKTI